MPEKIPAKVDYIKPLEDKPYKAVVKEKEDYLKELKKKLSDIVGAKNVKNDDGTLKKYSKDKSLQPVRRPTFVVYPKNRDEIQKIVALANESLTPVIPCSSGVHSYGATVPEQGGIVMDLKGMKKIFKIDFRHRAARIEPGVTYGELQDELEKHELRALIPLLPHPEKSVVSAHLEGEPMLIADFTYSEPLYTCELILPKGDIFRTGSAAPAPPEETRTDLVGPWGPGFDWNRLLARSQGTLGVVTWANIMAEPLPRVQKIFFTQSDDIERLVLFAYKIQHKWLGYECFALNRVNLAAILADKWPDDYLEYRKKLSEWTLIHCIAGTKRRPEEKVEWQETDMMEVAREEGVEPLLNIPQVAGAKEFFSKYLRRPWPKKGHWKEAYKGASADIFFLSTMDKAKEFIDALYDEATKNDYPSSDIGVYIQPIENGRACHIEFNIPYNPEDDDESHVVKNLHESGSERLMNLGGVFTRAYGKWAALANSRNAVQYKVSKQIKDVLDPNGIMNPGKLGL